MTEPTFGGAEELLGRLAAAVALCDVKAITERVKGDLGELVRAGKLQLPERFKKTRPDCYARRLLHRDPGLGYTAVVMAWGPGQRTPLHDHAGIWCVEGVVEGRMEVTRYDLVEEADGLFRFAKKEHVTAGVGSAGCLIPPFDYHVLGNAIDEPSITLHVYGGEMDHCDIYEPGPDGWYERRQKGLAYHD